MNLLLDGNDAVWAVSDLTKKSKTFFLNQNIHTTDFNTYKLTNSKPKRKISK